MQFCFEFLFHRIEKVYSINGKVAFEFDIQTCCFCEQRHFTLAQTISNLGVRIFQNQ